MKNHNFEKTQPGNPHQLTINQHIMPARSISRFSYDGFVEVKRLGAQNLLNLKSDNPLFCAKRVWSQGAETTGSKKIETNFQQLADLLVSHPLLTLSPNQNEVITEMYILWRSRHIYATDPPDDARMDALIEPKLSLENQEVLESKGVAFVRPDGTMPSRILTGIRIMIDRISAFRNGADKMVWGVAIAPDGIQFLCPDASIDQPLLPLSPSLCLVAGWNSNHVDINTVGMINRELVNGAKNYWFAKNLHKCPILRKHVGTLMPSL